MTKRNSSEQATGVSRRSILKAGAAAGLFSTVPWSAGTVRASPSPSIEKWADPLPRPSVLSPTSTNGGTDYYEIEMTDFAQQVLPSEFDETPLWGYGGSYPGPTIETRPGRKVEVKWINNLPTDHLLSVDPRVHGAGEPAPEVRTVTHVHGAIADPEDDGYPEAWVTPDGETTADFPEIEDSPVPYKQTKEYTNRQESATMWYHDHALGITRLNVYAGLAGFYLIRSKEEEQLGLPEGEYEVPILLQDRSFTSDGELFYPSGEPPYEAEFAGDVAVVNGKTWPYLEVEPRRYRFRLLNGSNGATFGLKLRNDSGDGVPLFHQIGTDLGFLDEVVSIGPGGDLGRLLMSGAERADVIVDFSEFAGETLTLTNDAGFPFTGTNFGTDVPVTEFMRFRVKDVEPPEDPSTPPEDLRLPVRGRTPPTATNTRYMTLDTGTEEVEGGYEYDTHYLNGVGTLWSDEDAVEKVQLGSTEIWELENNTGDSHPIHLHLVDFEVIGRGPDGTAPVATNEAGPKDTVLVNENETVRIRVNFLGSTGRYVWHCHILEHEDQEMMLPYEVVAGKSN